MAPAPTGRQDHAVQADALPLPPIFLALDANHDGVIDAGEIANAPAALSTLLKDGNTVLYPGDLLGPPPRGGGPGGRGRGGPGPDAQGGFGAPDMGRQGGPGGRRPLAPVFVALDANHDGVIDASEIANAPAALKTLLKNGNTVLHPEDLLGPPPRAGGPGGRGRGGPDGPEGGGPDGPDGPPPGSQ